MFECHTKKRVRSTLIWSKIKSDCLKCGWNTCGHCLSDTELHLWVYLCSVSIPTSCALWLAPGFDERSYFKAAFIYLIQQARQLHILKKKLVKNRQNFSSLRQTRAPINFWRDHLEIASIISLDLSQNISYSPNIFCIFSELKNGIIFLKPLLTQLTGDH